MQARAFEPALERANRVSVHMPVQAMLARAKAAWTTRHVDLGNATRLIEEACPQAGDLVLARVERLGQHGGLQLASGRRATLFEGDAIVVCYGNRYAPDQFEAEVPEDLGPCDLAAAGGIASQVRRQHARMRAPTRLTPLGLLADCHGQALNLRRFRMGSRGAGAAVVRASVPVITVVGTSMNAGKTTSAAALIRGLTAAGMRVGAAKLTGTGACGDTQLMEDAGAAAVVDFVDAGLATTFRAPLPEVEAASHWLVDALLARDVDVIVAEIADGLLQRETAALLESAAFTRRVSGVVFTSGDAIGAVAGTEWLERRGLRVLALSGVMTASPLAVREAVGATRAPVLDRSALTSVSGAMQVYAAAATEAAFANRACA
jgi:hypothetical protein